MHFPLIKKLPKKLRNTIPDLILPLITKQITLSQQQDHLLGTDGVVQGTGGSDSQSDIKYTLTVYRDGATTDLTGNVEDISLSSNAQESNIMRGTLNFYIGDN